MFQILLGGKHIVDQIVIGYGLILLTGLGLLALIALISYVQSRLSHVK